MVVARTSALNRHRTAWSYQQCCKGRAAPHKILRRTSREFLLAATDGLGTDSERGHSNDREGCATYYRIEMQDRYASCRGGTRRQVA